MLVSCSLFCSVQFLPPHFKSFRKLGDIFSSFDSTLHLLNRSTACDILRLLRVPDRPFIYSSFSSCCLGVGLNVKYIAGYVVVWK